MRGAHRVHRIEAVNTAADSENRIHDDAVAAAYGFRGGLVPGVTVYGYMCAPVLEHFGLPWLERGAMSVSFKRPVYEGETVAVESNPADDGRLRVTIDGERAIGIAWMNEAASQPRTAGHVGPAQTWKSAPVPETRPPASESTLAPGTVLGLIETRLDLAQARMSAPLPAAIGEERLAHPAILLALANDLLIRNVVLGPWIHASSEVTNFDAARDGDILQVSGAVTERFERSGHQFVKLDVFMHSGNRPVQHVVHTAIWRPRPVG